MKCHYEILEVPRDADDETIKKSYRRLALKWHPDKNLDRLDECTKYFALVQSAYEVLSDPHEKAFYDRHRESILRGGFGVDCKEDSLDLFKFFTTSCYTGYEGNESFFAVYKNVFDTLSKEDYEFIEDPSVCYPTFGDAFSDYETVTGPFYGFWSSFCTARSFAWLNKYDIRQASNRYELRQMEAENKKYRDAGKAQRNEQVRELVAFVRKRDPRVKAYRELLEKRHEEAKRKQEINRKKQIMRNQELASNFHENEHAMAAHRAHINELLEQLADDEITDLENDDGEEWPHCVVCEKSFKTMNALINHEHSKQHCKQLAELKRHMKEEDQALFEKEGGAAESSSRRGDRKGKKANRKAKKMKEIDEDSDKEVVNGGSMPSDFNAERPKDLDVEDDLSRVLDEVSMANTSSECVEEIMNPLAEKRIGKKKRRGEKNDPELAVNAISGAPAKSAPKTSTCDRCKEVFESRTKLFAHLKLTGHATIKVSSGPQLPQKNKKDRRK